MILGFADFEVGILETVGFDRRSTAFAKNGTYSMEFLGDTNLITWHNCISRVANNVDPFASYRGWKWWALGGWLYVDTVPASGRFSMIMSETNNNNFFKWAFGMDRLTDTTFRINAFYNKIAQGNSGALNVGTWYWVVWVMNRHAAVELWIDGVVRVNPMSGVNTMEIGPLPVYCEAEKEGKTDVNSKWYWDSMFLQDDFGFENADTPLTLNAAGLRVPVLTEAGSDKGGACGTGVRDWTDITLTSEYLRAVSLKEDGSGSGFQFEACDGSTNWDARYDNGKETFAIIEGAILGRRPDGARWTEANFNELGWGPRIDGVYPLIATVEEGAIGVSTRYKGLYPG